MCGVCGVCGCVVCVNQPMHERTILVFSPTVVHLDEQSVGKPTQLILDFLKSTLQTFDGQVRVLSDVFHVVVASHAVSMRFNQTEFVEQTMMELDLMMRALATQCDNTNGDITHGIWALPSLLILLT